ncbi:hypothetical protein B0H14DRAFT_2773652 [Mycena olivaceomarginata]|nr:hypothetical protein B0H14DRAFT_2773652 [Mycena olivaceomarginata]
MPIFHDANGIAVKFFVQKDLPQEVQNELCQTITSLGGRVETKVPRQGYILRFFVPYTYVEACKIAGMLLEQIFVDGRHTHQHAHPPSVANVNARSALSQRIMHSGGDPRGSAQSARVILADPNTDVFHHLIQAYQGVPEKHVESYLWVKKCNPCGRRSGEESAFFAVSIRKLIHIPGQHSSPKTTRNTWLNIL